MSSLTKDQIERIAFTKYLLSQAKIQKDKGIPTCSFAVLIMHDLVEIFLQVAVEILAPALQKPKAMILETLTNALNTILAPGGKAISMQFINRLNGRRNSLKHATIFVNSMDVQNLYSETETFFIDFNKILFQLDFDQISLVAMINNEKVKDYLHEAERHIENGDFIEAMLSITKSYHYLELSEVSPLGTIRGRVKVNYNRNLEIRSKSMSTGSNPDRSLKLISEAIEKDIKTLYETVSDIESIVRMGIDYRSFIKFRSFIPRIYMPNTKDKKDELYFFKLDDKALSLYNFDEENVKFCFDFVLSVSLKLQSLKI